MTTIGKFLFLGQTELTKVEMAPTVTKIGEKAFYQCSKMKFFKPSPELIEIGNYAFSQCTSLDKFAIPKKVTTVGNYAFSGCKSLTKMNIGKGINSIGTDAFKDCTSLVDVTYFGSKVYKTTGVFTNVKTTIANVRANYEGTKFFDLNVNKLTSQDAGKTNGSLYWMFDDIMGDIFFFGSGEMQNYPYTPASDRAPWIVKYGDQILEAEVEDGITSLGHYAFVLCKKLVKITVPDSITTYGNNVFEQCHSLLTFHIGSKVTKIPNNIWKSMTHITIDKSNKNFIYENAALYNSDKTNLISYMLANPQEHFEIPNTVTSLSQYAFYRPVFLKTVHIPASVTSIQNRTFFWGYDFMGVTVDSNNPNYSHDSDKVLYNKNKTRIIHYPPGLKYTEYKLKDTVKIVGIDSITGADRLKKLNLNKATTIDLRGIRACIELETLILPSTITYIGSEAIQLNTKLNTVEFEGTKEPTTCSNTAFYDNKNLKNVKVKSSYTQSTDKNFCGLTTTT